MGRALPGLMGPKTGHGSPRSEILATPLPVTICVSTPSLRTEGSRLPVHPLPSPRPKTRLCLLSSAGDAARPLWPHRVGLPCPAHASSPVHTAEVLYERIVSVASERNGTKDKIRKDPFQSGNSVERQRERIGNGGRRMRSGIVFHPFGRPWPDRPPPGAGPRGRGQMGTHS